MALPKENVCLNSCRAERSITQTLLHNGVKSLRQILADIVTIRDLRGPAELVYSNRLMESRRDHQITRQKQIAGLMGFQQFRQTPK
jgi:hypothetical protein